jgi:hypothetical protein
MNMIGLSNMGREEVAKEHELDIVIQEWKE